MTGTGVNDSCRNNAEAKMKSRTLTEDGQNCFQPTRGLNVALLRSEISFWKELIDTCDSAQSPDSLERMHQALALAELHLSTLSSSLQH
jgi:hypothetical protein